MKKLLFYLFFIICLPIHADNYKILQINSSSIQIGNTMCKQGDTFNDEDPIIWTAEKQAIKAMNLRTGQIRIFVGEAFVLIVGIIPHRKKHPYLPPPLAHKRFAGHENHLLHGCNPHC